MSKHKIVGPESLDWREVPINWDAVSGDTIPAGTPLDAQGNVANDGTAYGILMDDVERRRNKCGRVIVAGVIDMDAAEEHSGVALSDACVAALEKVWFGYRNGGKPTHYDTRKTEEVVIEWDGNTEGLYTPVSNVLWTICKVSDNLPTFEMLDGSTMMVMNEGAEVSYTLCSWGNGAGADGTLWIEADEIGNIYSKDRLIIVITTPTDTYAETGVYFQWLGDNVYVKSLTYTVNSGELKQLEPKYIKDMYYEETNVEKVSYTFGNGSGSDGIRVTDADFVAKLRNNAENAQYFCYYNGVEKPLTYLYKPDSINADRLSWYICDPEIETPKYGNGLWRVWINNDTLCVGDPAGNNGGPHHITIEFDDTKTVVHPIDQKYVPNADWNAAEGETGHVLNRTHYTEVVAGDLLSAKSWEIIGGVCCSDDAGDRDNGFFSFGLYEGSDYKSLKVIWDGVEYILPIKVYNDYGWGVGNFALIKDAVESGEMGITNGYYASNVDHSDTGEPFAFVYTSYEYSHLNIAVAEDGMHTYEVYTAYEVVHPIDPKYLPEGSPVIQSAEVGQTIVVKAVDEYGVPTEWEAVSRETWCDDLLASGTLVADISVLYDTGITLAKLREYKTFAYKLKGNSNVDLSNLYLLLTTDEFAAHGPLKGSAVERGNKSGRIAYFEWANDEKTILRPVNGYNGTSSMVSFGSFALCDGTQISSEAGQWNVLRYIDVSTRAETDKLYFFSDNAPTIDYAFEIRGLTK